MEREKIVDSVHPRVLVCVSAHESILYLSYSFVALVKVIFLCGGIRRCGFCVWNGGTCCLLFLCPDASCLMCILQINIHMYNLVGRT